MQFHPKLVWLISGDKFLLWKKNQEFSATISMRSKLYPVFSVFTRDTPQKECIWMIQDTKSPILILYAFQNLLLQLALKSPVVLFTIFYWQCIVWNFKLYFKCYNSDLFNICLNRISSLLMSVFMTLLQGKSSYKGKCSPVSYLNLLAWLLILITSSVFNSLILFLDQTKILCHSFYSLYLSVYLSLSMCSHVKFHDSMILLCLFFWTKFWFGVNQLVPSEKSRPYSVEGLLRSSSQQKMF